MAKQQLDPLSQAAKTVPNKIAIHTSTKTYTYKELHQTICAVATTIKTTIKTPKIALNIANPLDLLICIFACQYAKKHCFLLNHHLNTFNTSITKQFKISTVLTTCPQKSTDYDPNLSTAAHITINIFTSGSSAQPKCVVHTAKQFIESAMAVSTATTFTQTSCWLICLPLFHVAGLACVFRTFCKMSTLILDNPKNTSVPYTHISLVNQQLKTYLDHPPPSSLSCILVGGSALDPELKQKALQKKFPLYVSYGCTETASAITIGHITSPNAKDSGQCLEHSNISIKNKQINITSTALCNGYLYPPNNLETLPNQTLVTMDTGYLTDDNRLVITGRADRTIIINGENINLCTIENQCRQLPDINQLYIIDITLNEDITLVAFIDSTTSLKTVKKTITSHIQSMFSSLFVPKHFLELPKNNALKSNLTELKNLAKTQLEQNSSN